jgi:hypothetical protein
VSSTPTKKPNDSTDKVEYYKYVPHHQQKKWEELGWTFHCDLGPPHAAYSSLYKWEGSGTPVEPDSEIKITKKIDMEIDNDTDGELRGYCKEA